MRHAQRGQAIFETVLFLPLFLLALFGMMWAVQAAVQYERVESAVRYAGLISQEADPYPNYSLYSMFTQLGSTALPKFTCVTPLTDPLSDAAPTYSSSQTTTASPPFFSPATTPVPGCSPSSGIVGIQAGTGLAQDVIFSQQEPSITSNVAVPPYLQKALGSLSTTMSASERFFAPVGINSILACYPALNAQINESINYGSDNSVATTPVPLSSTVIALSPAPNAACMTF